MAKNLVIVESPAKAGTIGKYLGADYQVIASMGHVRDLPASKLGVDVEKDFLPQYVIPPKARKTITSLKKALKDKKRVLLATDLDREGEAIAWHILQALELDKQPDLQIQRITFDEITKEAITEAVAHPRDLDIQLIDAQQARRVLDRLVGYTLSPVLWKKIYKGLSAGRVQSVALRLIVERERERLAFKPVEYWSLQALLHKKADKQTFWGGLSNYDGKKIEQLTLTSGAEVQKIIEALKNASYMVKDVGTKQVKRRPSPPYITSTFQQDAVNKLGMSSKRAMQVAQKLYEGGYITYMRTDSVSLANVALEHIRGHIKKEYGADFLPEQPTRYANKSKNAQEAHEAIRPTNPDTITVPGEPPMQKVYDLIRRRAVASQMKEANLEQTTVLIEAEKAEFKATGQRILFPGFLSVWGKDEDNEEQKLPLLVKGDALAMDELKDEQHFTEPPPRYSEATLIKALEEQGIGRPSTYAPTMDTLEQRRYVKIEQRRLVPEEVGFLVTDLLVEHFPEIVDLQFTAGMEDKLDKVASGEAQYATTLAEFWKPFNELVKTNTEKIAKVSTTEETDEICPTCGAPMVIKMGRYGKFLACTRFPECKTTKPIIAPEASNLICPRCGKPLTTKRARRGVFFGCSGYPECTVAIWKKDQLPKKITELEAEGIELPFKEQSLAAFNEK